MGCGISITIKTYHYWNITMVLLHQWM